MRALKILGLVGVSLVTAVTAVLIYARFIQPETRYVEIVSEPAYKAVSFPEPLGAQAMDFTGAAELSIHAVVHVLTTELREVAVNPLYEFFYGSKPDNRVRPVLGFGSGVIISPDGYIVTNNHVIEGSDEIEVTMNDRQTFKAALIGTDPTTDIAVLKIDAKDLPTIEFGDSDNLRLGEWVLAVGNPYNLTSTVTAGIVSAKSRDIGIMPGDFSLESFIQTDAAVNPGNSGGALVNTSGKLVGINTAIASRTGNYTGYSFAIPVSIVRKVVADLMEFGEVQRARLGVTISDINTDLAEEKKLGNTQGVYISDVDLKGGAKEAGIKAGDVIISVNDIKVNTSTELQEQIGKYRPNDKVKVLIKRAGELKPYTVVLRNMEGGTEFIRSSDVIEPLGATFEQLTQDEKKALGIAHGIRVVALQPGKFMRVGIKKGFVVTSINKKTVDSVNDIAEILQGLDGGVFVEGVYEDGSRSYYAFGLQ